MDQALELNLPSFEKTGIESSSHEIRDESRFWDVFLAALLLIPAIPFFFVLYTLHLLTIRDGDSFFYKGVRLGKGKRYFEIYKIRTMVPHAEHKIGADLFDEDPSLLLWYGNFLRQTRLDELPQLINILKGDMGFIGPRPVRPSIYKKFQHISNYDLRFSRRPGLTGYAQFLTPYGTSKKIRARIDNHFIKGRSSSFSDIGLILWTISRCVYSSASEIIYLSFQRSRMLQKGIVRKNERTQKRRKPQNVRGFVIELPDEMVSCNLIDINSSSLLLAASNKLILPAAASATMYVEIKRNKRNKKKRVKLNAVVFQTRTKNGRNGHSDYTHYYLADYSAKSEYHRYLIDKYLLKNSVAGI